MSASITALSPVAKSFFAFCKKCDSDRWHTVLAHTSSTAAKLKCEVCASVKSWTLPKAPRPGVKTPERVIQKRAATESARQSAYRVKYEGLLKAAIEGAQESYSIRGKFQMNQRLSHPKFGMGIVTAVFVDKVEVFFSDETRVLVHNRQ